VPCYRPIEAWAPQDGGALVFREREDCREVKIACGKCIGCLEVRKRDWAIRCLCEAQMHKANSFVTLTYDEKNYEVGLNLIDWQRFMYRLRKKKGPVRFFMGGEYGTEGLRPHWHAILFGCRFSNLQSVGKDLYRSEELEQLWPKGFSSIGEVTYKSASYVAKYVTKKHGEEGRVSRTHVDLRTGEEIEVPNEFGTMSLNPGIGHAWIWKNWREVYLARDGIVEKGGRVSPSPRYFDKQLEKIDVDLREYKSYERYKKSKEFLGDTTRKRLETRELIATENHKRKRLKI